MSLWDGDINQSPFIGDRKNHHPGSDTSSQRGRSQSLNIENLKSQKYDKSWLASEKELKQDSIHDKLSLKSLSSLSQRNESLNKNYLERFGNYFLTKNKITTVGRNRDLNLDKSSSSSSSASTTTSSIEQNHDVVSPNITTNHIVINNGSNISDSSKHTADSINKNSINENVSSDTSKNLCDNLMVKEVQQMENITITKSGVGGGGGGVSSSRNGNDGTSLERHLNRDEVNSFLLPRIVIKHNGSSSSNSNEDITFERGYETKSVRRHQQQHHIQNSHQQQTTNSNHHHHQNHSPPQILAQSNYSTEKSGSSGYYGSNLYSTGSGSFDEHIYEPVVDKFDTKRSKITPMSGARRPHLLARGECCEINCEDSLDYTNKKIYKLPTIMEGVDGQIPRPVWPSDFDDSLIDINLESFLLINENNRQPLENNYRSGDGNDNLGYQQKSVDRNPIKNPSSEHVIYMRKYENDVNVYQTREILEEIRKKVNNLLVEKSVSPPPRAVANSTQTNPFRSTEYQDMSGNSLKLQNEIKSLKNDLDRYIRIINNDNEKKIKQLCAGLSKDTKLLTMKKALENRARTNQDNLYEIFDDTLERNYDKMKPTQPKPTQQEFGTVYVHNGFNVELDRIPSERDRSHTNPFVQRQTSIRSSDPNFHFQFKSTPNSYGMQYANGTNNSSEDTSTTGISSSNDNSLTSSDKSKTNLKQNLSLQNPGLVDSLGKPLVVGRSDKDMILEWHKNKPSIWEQYYGKNRPQQTLFKKVCYGSKKNKCIQAIVSYPSTRPESDFTLDLPRAEQLRIKMKKEKRFRSRCRILLTFFSLIFFLLTVMSVSLILTRGKRMFGSML